ncbi:MAG: hypothetical protein JJU37_03700 [Balneolaceae bacterium]|nr:hypothetical protein [Balneolaceae bacterium]
MKNHANITLILSLLFLLVAGAFTLAPETNSLHTNTAIEEMAYPVPDLNLPELEEASSGCTSGCCTCTFGSGGAPNGCANAGYCGLTECKGGCDQSDGILCGECAGCADPTVPCSA